MERDRSWVVGCKVVASRGLGEVHVWGSEVLVGERGRRERRERRKAIIGDHWPGVPIGVCRVCRWSDPLSPRLDLHPKSPYTGWCSVRI